MVNKGFGGAERIFFDTCFALARRGNHVLAVCHTDFKFADALERESNITVFRSKLLSRNDPIAKFFLWLFLCRHQPDLVHIHLLKGIRFAQNVAKLLKIPVLSSVHNYNSLCSYQHSQAVIAITTHQVTQLEKVLPASIPVYHVPNFSRINPKESYLKTTKNNKHFVALGRFVAKKGFDVLLDAFAILVAKRPDVTLTLAGNGELRAELEAQIKALGLQKNVDLCGWIEDVDGLIDSADVLVVPSRDEPFGVVILEGMARAKLIVSTRTHGANDILRPESALLCEIGCVQSMAKQLLSAASTEAQIVAELHDKSEQALKDFKSTYTEKAVLPRLEHCYERVMASK